MRNKYPLFTFFAVLIVLICVEASAAQYKSAVPSPYRNSGNVIKVEQNQPTGSLSNFFDMKMSHSYEASFSSFGGQTSNLNMYTNSMFFTFSPKFTGKLDMAFAHSPFGGNSVPGMNGNNGSQFFIRNAELNYSFSENTKLSFSFQQLPYGSYYGNGFNRGGMGSNAWLWN